MMQGQENLTTCLAHPFPQDLLVVSIVSGFPAHDARRPRGETSGRREAASAVMEERRLRLERERESAKARE